MSSGPERTRNLGAAAHEEVEALQLDVVALPVHRGWKSKVTLGLLVAGAIATIFWAVLLCVLITRFASF